MVGMGAGEASAAVIADVTTELFAQGLYVLTGVLASLSLLHASRTLSPYVDAMLGGASFVGAALDGATGMKPPPGFGLNGRDGLVAAA